METHAGVTAAERPGLAKKPYSAGLGILSITSSLISIFAAWALAFDFLGYHGPNSPPHPEFLGFLLLFGLSLAVIGQLLGAGRNEGIRTRGWLGILDVLLIRLALAGFVFMGTVLRYALHGKVIPLSPVGILTIVSGLFIASRLIARYVFHIDRLRRTKV